MMAGIPEAPPQPTLGDIFALDPKPIVEITSPMQGDKVRWSETVIGKVQPSNELAQLFIYSGDGFWWRQFAQNHQNTWRVQDCKIGREGAPSGSRYYLVAVSGAKKTEQKVSELPEGKSVSPRITVYRRTAK
jgi:hypothetical protein